MYGIPWLQQCHDLVHNVRVSRQPLQLMPLPARCKGLPLQCLASKDPSKESRTFKALKGAKLPTPPTFGEWALGRSSFFKFEDERSSLEDSPSKSRTGTPRSLRLDTKYASPKYQSS